MQIKSKEAGLMKRFLAAIGVSLFVVSTVHAGNGANDYLLSVAPQIQATTLAKAVGNKCVGQTASTWE